MDGVRHCQKCYQVAELAPQKPKDLVHQDDRRPPFEVVKQTLISASNNEFPHSVAAMGSLSPGPHVPCKYEF